MLRRISARQPSHAGDEPDSRLQVDDGVKRLQAGEGLERLRVGDRMKAVVVFRPGEGVERLRIGGGVALRCIGRGGVEPRAGAAIGQRSPPDLRPRRGVCPDTGDEGLAAEPSPVGEARRRSGARRGGLA